MIIFLAHQTVDVGRGRWVEPSRCFTSTTHKTSAALVPRLPPKPRQEESRDGRAGQPCSENLQASCSRWGGATQQSANCGGLSRRTTHVREHPRRLWPSLSRTSGGKPCYRQNRQIRAEGLDSDEVLTRALATLPPLTNPKFQ